PEGFLGGGSASGRPYGGCVEGAVARIGWEAPARYSGPREKARGRHRSAARARETDSPDSAVNTRAPRVRLKAGAAAVICINPSFGDVIDRLRCDELVMVAWSACSCRIRV